MPLAPLGKGSEKDDSAKVMPEESFRLYPRTPPQAGFFYVRGDNPPTVRSSTTGYEGRSPANNICGIGVNRYVPAVWSYANTHTTSKRPAPCASTGHATGTGVAGLTGIPLVMWGILWCSQQIKTVPGHAIADVTMAASSPLSKVKLSVAVAPSFSATGATVCCARLPLLPIFTPAASCGLPSSVSTFTA